MYNHNMIEFARTYYPNAPIHKTFMNDLVQVNKSFVKLPTVLINKSQKKIIKSKNDENKLLESNIIIKEQSTQNTDNHTCKFCKCTFQKRFDLLKHIKQKQCKSKNFAIYEATHVKKYKCPYCHKAFTRTDNLKRHQVSICPLGFSWADRKKSSLSKFFEEEYFKNNTEKMTKLEEKINNLNLEKQEILKQLNEIKNSDHM